MSFSFETINIFLKLLFFKSVISNERLLSNTSKFLPFKFLASEKSFLTIECILSFITGIAFSFNFILSNLLFENFFIFHSEAK